MGMNYNRSGSVEADLKNLVFVELLPLFDVFVDEVFAGSLSIGGLLVVCLFRSFSVLVDQINLFVQYSNEFRFGHLL
jgi:hypothetical protein